MGETSPLRSLAAPARTILRPESTLVPPKHRRDLEALRGNLARIATTAPTTGTMTEITGGGGHLPPTVTIPTVARAPRITAGDPPFGMQPGSPCAFAEFFFQAFCHRDLSLSSSPSSPSSGFSPADRFRFETCVYLSVHECGFVFAASFYQLVIVLSTWSSQKNYFWICMYTKSATPVVHEYSHCRYLFSLNSIVCVGQLFLAKQTAVEAALFKFSKRV
mmetsp:Transcript_9429/g.16259  ORF Transcript_9429/g.16259 Transcript_9429/m.16259 type:complete len:219 (-) Transcript_9429:183-839(-)